MEYQFPSPDGRWMVDLEGSEFRMSLWVWAPELREQATGRSLFYTASDWDAGGITWSEDSQVVTMYLRHYPDGTTNWLVQLYPNSDLARIAGPDGEVQCSLQEAMRRFGGGFAKPQFY